MATFLLWVSWRDTQPDPAIWERLVARSAGRSRMGGSERSGLGFRAFAAATRCHEPPALLQRRSADGQDEIILLDRATGPHDGPGREALDGSDARLLDGTPTAAARLATATLKVSLFRDLMGQRRLVYAAVPGGWLVASGEDVLRHHPDICGDHNLQYLAAYFCAVAPDPTHTAFARIHSVAPGETVIIEGGRLTRRQQPFEPDWSWQGISDRRIVERFSDLLRKSVADACRGSAGIGISLSAGLDSSSIAATASRSVAAPPGGILAITQGFDEWPEIDERSMASALCADLSIRHQSVAVDELLPFSDPRLRPICPDAPHQTPYREWKETTYNVLEAAGIEVLLCGDFGDYLFAGAVEWLVDALRFRRFALAARQILGQVRSGGLSGAMRNTALRRPFSRLLGRVSDISPRLDWIRPEYREPIRERLRADLERHRDFPRPLHAARIMDGASAIDASGEQWFAHRHGMEVRMPFRDLALTRFCLSLPADFFERDQQRKWLLREAMRGTLIEALRTRAKGSDLTSRYVESTRLQAPVLAQLRRRAADIRAQVVGREPDDEAGKRIAEWLAASFGSWLSLRDD